MNKGLLKLALLTAVCASMPASFTSCKDYDDDINNLQGQIDQINTTVKSIQEQVSKGGIITSVVPTSDNKGIVITVEKDGQSTSYTIQNGKDGRDADVWTINADGFWCCNGTPTDYKAIGQDGKDGAQGQPGAPGTPGAPGAPGDYYKPNGEGYFDLYTWDAATQSYVLKQKNAVPYATANDHVTAVVTANDVFLYGVDGADGAIVLAKTGALRGLQFKPDFYYQGIEAMDAATFKFKALDLKTVNANGNFGADAPTMAADFTSMTPALVANYYLNPSSANIDNIFELSFITEDLQYARAASSVTAQIFDSSAKDGILTVKANLQGDLKDINEDDMVTVLALQARLNQKAAAVDTVITSDFAAVKASYYTDIDLAVPAKATNVNLVNSANPGHWYTTAAEAIAAPAALKIAWNDSKGINLSEFIQADYTNSKGNHIAWAKPVNEYGFKYVYELVGYQKGNNQTSQSAHAALNPDNNAIIRAQMTKDGKAQPWGYEQNKATLGREPLVRVSLVDTVSAGKPVAAVAYVKLEIVPEGVIAPEDAITPVAFTFTDPYTVSCSDKAQLFKLSWSQVEENILAALKMSKEVFEDNYELRMYDQTQGIAQQVVIASDKTINNATVTHGMVTKLPDPNLPQGTEVISWTITAPDVYDYFTGSTKPKDMSVIVVYDGKKGTAYAHNHVAITLKWTPAPLNVNPTATIDDNSKIAELWFSYNSGTSASNGGLKQETHLNVAVPNNNLSSSACTFVNNLLYPFVGNKIGIKDLDVQTYPDYKDPIASFAFTDVANAPKKVKGMSGATYVLSHANGNLQAYLDGNPLTAVDVAVIDNTAGTVTYQENNTAWDILNFAGAQELLYDQTLSATMKISAANSCGKPLAVSNDTYNVRFLRPISVITKKPANLKDGVDAGSTLEVATCIGFKDWRNINFTDANRYLSYYGVEGVFVGILNSDNGTVSAVVNGGDITEHVTTNLNGGSIETQKLSEVLPDIRLTYTPAGTAISLSSIGVLNYKNAGNVLGYEFTIRVPFVVKYKWGYVKLDFDITIEPTIGQ